MNTLTKETWQVLRYNQLQIGLFEIAYRLITAPLYLLLLNKGVQFALRMARYSYLTASNIGYFLLKPWTAAVFLALLAVSVILISVEAGALLTAFQANSYSRKLTMGEIFLGGLGKCRDEGRKKNWKLGLFILLDYLLLNSYLIYLLMTHVKPLNFIITEMGKQAWGRIVPVAVIAVGILCLIPGIYVFHACMIEQKTFRDGYHRSRQLIKGHGIKTFFMLAVYGVGILLAFRLVYAFGVVIMAIAMTLVKDNRLALAMLPEAGNRFELFLLFFVSMILYVTHFAALNVQYYQYNNGLNREPRWDFSYPPRKSLKGRMLAGGIGIAAALSLFFLFDAVYNGSAFTDDLLLPVQITAHRGSSKTAPENTMSALRLAVEDFSDYAEIDVQETKDGFVVLGHDSNLRRVAGLNRTISSFTLEELMDLDVGSWFSAEFKEERIPALEDVLDFCRGKIHLNVEIKNMGKNSGLPDKVVALIEAHQMQEQCVVTSTSLTYLKRVRELNPALRTGYIISAAYGDFFSSDYYDFISIRSSFVNEKMVELAHEKGKGVHAWTVNTKSEMERMKMVGVDNIITDYPVLAREIVYREESTENLLEYIRLVLK